MSLSATTPLSADRLSDQIAERLLARIVSGEFAPGECLPGERQLALQLGVSRVSIRSALQALKTRGLLQAVQGGGTRVISTAVELESPMKAMIASDKGNLRDLAEIRLNLESWAAAKAAINASPDDIARLERIVGKMEHGRQRTADDVDFHMTLAKASGSAIYAHIMDVIREALKAAVGVHREEMHTSAAANRTLLEQHRAILDAVRRRDPAAAEAAMRQHLGWVITQYDLVTH